MSVRRSGISTWMLCPDGVRRQNIWLRMRCGLAERLSRPGVDVKRRGCGAASADVGYFQEDSVIQGLMPALDLTLGLGLHGDAPDKTHPWASISSPLRSRTVILQSNRCLSILHRMTFKGEVLLRAWTKS